MGIQTGTVVMGNSMVISQKIKNKITRQSYHIFFLFSFNLLQSRFYPHHYTEAIDFSFLNVSEQCSVLFISIGYNWSFFHFWLTLFLCISRHNYCFHFSFISLVITGPSPLWVLILIVYQLNSEGIKSMVLFTWLTILPITWPFLQLP